MAYTIPDVPSEIKTQIQRERLLAKEARYESGLAQKDEYDELLAAVRETSQGSRLSTAASRLSDIIRRSSIVRRLSKQSLDDAHNANNENSKPKHINTSTVWEVP